MVKSIERPIRLPYTARGPDTKTSVNAYAVIATWWVKDVGKATIVFRETGGVNGVTYQIEGSLDGTNYTVLDTSTGVDVVVVANGMEYETIVELWEYLKISIKSTVGGSHGDGSVELLGERMG